MTLAAAFTSKSIGVRLSLLIVLDVYKRQPLLDLGDLLAQAGEVRGQN